MQDQHQFQPSSSASFTGPSVVLVGTAPMEVANLLVRGIRDAQQRDGIAPSPRLLATVSMIISAADMVRASRSGLGQPLAFAPGAGAGSDPSTARELLSSKEVAALLGVSDRHVRRLADDLGGRFAGYSRVFDRAAVEEYARAPRPSRRRR